MEIFHSERVPRRVADSPVASARGLRLAPHATEDSPGGILGFAERALGFPLEEKQRELLRNAGRRVILNCTRQWGKSWMAAVAVLFHALSKPGATVVLAGPGLRQSGELFLKVRALARRMGMRTKGDGVNSLSAVLENGARIVAVPARADTIVGFSGVSMLVIDEAAIVEDEVYFAVRPMLTQSRGTIWLLSTPRSKVGFFWREFSRSQTTGGTASTGEEWMRLQVRATDCPRFDAATLEAEKISMGAKLFAREFLCEFVEVDDGMFCEEWFDEAFLPNVRPLEGL